MNDCPRQNPAYRPTPFIFSIPIQLLGEFVAEFFIFCLFRNPLIEFSNRPVHLNACLKKENHR